MPEPAYRILWYQCWHEHFNMVIIRQSEPDLMISLVVSGRMFPCRTVNPVVQRYTQVSSMSYGPLSPYLCHGRLDFSC